MKLKRIRCKDSLSPLVAIQSGERWIPLEPALSPPMHLIFVTEGYPATFP